MRVTAPLVVILLAAITYGFMLVALSLFERFLPRIAFIYGLFFYYVGLFGAPFTPLFWWIGLNDQVSPDDSFKYFNPMVQVASCWATAAAAYNAIFDDVPSNTSLERTRDR